MPLPPRRHWLSLPVQVALALFGGAAVFTADARAGCGDYVQVLGENGRAAAPAHHDHAPAAPGKGPACDRQAPPMAPLAPAPTAAGPQTQLDAILMPADRPDAARPAGVTGVPVPEPIHLRSSIFRPPRRQALG